MTFSIIRTQDGPYIARDPKTGITVSRPTREEAEAELRRLLGQGVAS